MPKQSRDQPRAARLDEEAVRHIEGKQDQHQQDAGGQRQHQMPGMKHHQVGPDHRHQHQCRDQHGFERRQQRQQQRQRRAGQQQQQEFRANHVWRALLDVAIKDAADQIGMNLDSGIHRVYRCCPQIEQSWCRGADQGDLAAQFFDRNTFVQHIHQRVIPVTAFGTTIRYQRRRLKIDGDFERTGLDPLQAAVFGGTAVLTHHRHNGRLVVHRPHHRQ